MKYELKITDEHGNEHLYNVVRCLLSFFNYWGTANWYQGIDKPTLWQRIYKWRISPKTAWTLANGIWLDGYSE